MLKKNSLILLIFLLSLINISCTQVPNVPICKEITPDKGYCAYTIQEGGFIVDDNNPYKFDGTNFQTWWEIRPMMIQIPPNSWKELKQYIIKQCKKTKDCNDIGEWFLKMEKENEGNE